jgi:D-glycero-D-manno-heptose 1,7-bisphosphate phosphatase
MRDGRPFPPATLADLEILPGVQDACGRLKRAGVPLFCVTNQPDVARGLSSRAAVEEINRYLHQELDIDDFAVCWHDDADQCACRKPLPGLLVSLAQQYGINLATSVMVGDRWRDIEAGQQAECATVFIDYCYQERRPTADATFPSLAHAVPWIVDFLTDRGA